MISFENDYSETTNESILKALQNAKDEQNAGYGLDIHCKNAEKLIKKECGHEDIDVHFIQGGTPCNVLVSQLLKPYEAMICVKSGHINVHETGAVEHFGHKILIADDKEGKILPESIESIVNKHTDEHMVKPALVFIANGTEYGTSYTKDELLKIKECCDRHNLILYIDGARIANALLAEKITLKDIADIADVFYIGGTKNGALIGEAFVIKKENLKKDFRYIIKQNCSMLAKGFVSGIEFETLFTNNLYYENAKHANEMADLIRNTLKEKGIKVLYETKTNQIFPILTNEQFDKLSKEYIFSKWDNYDKNHIVTRFVTSWNTKEENVKKLINSLLSI